MSLFNNNIKNDIPSIAKGKKWMIANIKDVVDHYIHHEFLMVFTHHLSPTYSSDKDEMDALKQQIRLNWMNHSTLLKFSISATDTEIIYSTTSGYKYEVTVKVRFIWEDQLENYVDFVRIPIISDFERTLYDRIACKKFYERYEHIENNN